MLISGSSKRCNSCRISSTTWGSHFRAQRAVCQASRGPFRAWGAWKIQRTKKLAKSRQVMIRVAVPAHTAFTFGSRACCWTILGASHQISARDTKRQTAIVTWQANYRAFQTHMVEGFEKKYWKCTLISFFLIFCPFNMPGSQPLRQLLFGHWNESSSPGSEYHIWPDIDLIKLCSWHGIVFTQASFNKQVIPLFRIGA